MPNTIGRRARNIMLDHELTNGHSEARRLEIRVPSKESLRASGQVQSLSRALKLLNALSYYPQGLPLSEIALEVGLPNSTAHRLLTTLQNERYVRFDSEHSAWVIGVQAFRVGSAFVRARDMVSIARPFMRRLVDQSGETVNLGIIDRDEVVYLAQVETQKMMRAIAGPGGRAAIHCSGIGKALLSYCNENDRRQLLERMAYRRETPKTHVTRESLSTDMQRGVEHGYFLDDEENAIGLRCVAAVIFNEHGEPIAGLSVSGPAARITNARIPSLGKGVAAVADEITLELGGHKPYAS